MQLRGDDRAAAIQVGAIVLFAFVIIAITAYQASVVPSQNEEIEYNHNQRVQGQLQDLEAAVGSTSGTGDARTVTVDLSTSYPARTIFVNPPRPNGRLQTVGTRNATVAFEVRNATATNPDADDFWDGSTRNYSTGAVVYQPNYNVYNQAPRTVVENSLVYNEFADATLATNQQSLFDGNTISLTALRGSLREDGGTASVNVRPVSADTTTVAVEGDGTDNVTVSIVSRLSPSDWRQTVVESGERYNQSGGHVVDVTGGQIGSLNGAPVYRVNFTMERGQSYDLQLARVGVGSLTSGEDTTNASYTVAVTDAATTDEGVNATVTVEVRDQYGNPKGGVAVNATAVGSAGGTVVDPTRNTSDDGRVTFTYDPPNDVSSTQTDTVRVSFSGDPAAGFDETAPANVTVDVTVRDTDGGGGGGGGGGAYSIGFEDGSSYSWDVATQGSEINLTAITDPSGIEGVSTDFAVNDSSVANVQSEMTETNSSGEADVRLNANANGTVAVYVGSGGSSDVINVTVTGVGGGGGGGSNSAPTASFTVTPSSPLVNEPAEFDATGSSDSDGSITSYEWDFGDGSPNESGVTPEHRYSSSGTYTVTLTVTDDDGATDTTTKTVTVRALPKLSAVEPDPDALDDSEGEFVRVYFPTSTDVSGWSIDDGDDGGNTTLPSTTLSGEIYFARDPTAFANQWGIDPSRVYTLDTQLANSGESLVLRTENGRVIDEFAYNGPTTSNGWTLNGVDAGEVAVRKTDGSGDYVDTNSSSDWLIENENTFFGSDTGRPLVSSASVTNAPINYTDTDATQTVTVTFNESMNTNVDPTVEITDLPNSNDLAVSGSWVDSTTWEGTVDFQKNDEATATIRISGAEDDSGNLQDPDPDTSNTFVVDTKRPQDPDSARIATDPIASTNETDVTVEVNLSSPREPGTVYVKLTGPDGNTVTGSAPVNTGGKTTTVTGIDASSLADGGNAISVSARVVDDYGNENQNGFVNLGNNATKDTTAPTFNSLRVKANPSSNQKSIDSVTFDYNASDNVKIDAITVSGDTKKGTFTTTIQVGSTTTVNSYTEDIPNDDEPDAPIDVTVKITDGVGNTYTCSGTLSNADSEITLNDMNCTSTLRNIRPVVRARYRI